MTKYIDAGSSGEWGWHATEVALRCPRLYAYNYRMPGGRPDTDRAPLLKGSLIHQGLAHYYARRRATDAGLDPDEWATPDDAIDDCARKLGQYAGQYVDLAKRTLAQYAAHWARERLEVLHVEDVFESEIGGYKFTQRLDLVVREPDGKVWAIDHKAVGRISATIAERYTLSGQFLGMASFGRAIWGDDFGGVKLNLIEIGDDKPCRFARRLPDPAPAALKGFTLTVLHAREKVARLDASGLPAAEWPMALSEQVCITAYGRCDHFDRCRWGAAPGTGCADHGDNGCADHGDNE